MTEIKDRLFEAFKEDHALLGRGFFELGQALRAGDKRELQLLAGRIDAEAGAHVGFEEKDFYPALAELTDPGHITRFHHEHGEGFDVLQRILSWNGETDLTSEVRAALLAKVRIFEDHIAECGEMFGLLGGMPPSEQARLFDRLQRWRDLQPSWSDVESGKAAPDGVP